LLAALGLAPRGLALLVHQHALAGREFGRGQLTATAASIPAAPTAAPTVAAIGRRALILRLRRRRGSCGSTAAAASTTSRRTRTHRKASLSDLNLNHLRAAVAEALPYRTRVLGPPDLQASRRAQRKPPLARVLIVAFAHYPVRLTHSKSDNL
jgi:hypothetical protein